MKQAIETWVDQHAADLEKLYEHLHILAEISWQEVNTTAFLQHTLNEMNVPNQIYEEHTGIVAEWLGTSPLEGRIIAVRADMDALWQNVDGVWKANHSCGHDAHMTMVLSALKCLKGIGFQPAGKLIVIFQPAEETGEGAKKMLELGVLDEVEHLLGIHLRPLKELEFGKASSAIRHGAAVFMEGKVTGRQAHASRPNDGINVIDALAAIVNAVNAVKVDPTVPASCKVTRMNVENSSVNIIPDLGEFSIDIRAQTNEAMEEMLKKVEAAVGHAAIANGATLEGAIGARMVAAVPNEYLEGLVGAAIKEILGDAGLVSPPVTPGGEDFHFYPLLKPDLNATMIGLGSGLVPGLHHPQMSFNLEALQIGTKIIALSIIKLFDQAD